MSSARAPTLAAAVGLLASAALGVASATAERLRIPLDNLGLAQLVLAVFGFVLPAFAALYLHSLEKLAGATPARVRPQMASTTLLTGAFAAAASLVVLPAHVAAIAAGAASLLILAGAAGLAAAVMAEMPSKAQATALAAAAPLAKGDAACWTQARFAHFMLLPGLAAALAGGPWLLWDTAWARPLWLAGLHLLLAGYALVSVYALGHLWVPRLSGVPAIAAGAIKGELHTSLLGLLLLLAGFALDAGAGESWARGLRVAGGALLFLGAFTYMGVLGANIMRNKSATQRITPEFVYVPWSFAGIFWLVSGLLLGVFLNVAQRRFPERLGELTFVHSNSLLLGGMALLLLGWAHRILPAARGESPPPFGGLVRLAFLTTNAGIAIQCVAAVAAGAAGPWWEAGAALAFLGFAASFVSLARHQRA